MDHTEFSRKGGSSKSERKRQAARDNVAKARLAKAALGSTKEPARTAELNSQEGKALPTDSAGTSASTNSA
jgi:hypothetical protein